MNQKSVLMGDDLDERAYLSENQRILQLEIAVILAKDLST